ncbi:MAG: TetR/AcrR family transcriptional regulator [Deltaproteobacteria bacterium]|nr:TetR/AcrR family transcriptional regulator [Deltaproteobacteria bacterium]MBW2725997.1 TetR/AcrR family transcriptional regulator [Deltaproteobacteria bacterium]
MAVAGAKGKAKKAKEELYRQLILDAAQGVFADNGYDDAKIGEIAEASGVSLQTLYSVFPGKAAIYQEIQESGDQELHRRSIEWSQAISDPLPAMLAGLRATTLYFLEQPNFLKLRLHGGFTWGAESSAAGSRGRTEAWRAALERLRGACQQCIEEGVFVDRDPSLIARMVVSMQQVELAHWLEGGMAGDPERVATDLEEQVERAFRRPGSIHSTRAPENTPP